MFPVELSDQGNHRFSESLSLIPFVVFRCEVESHDLIVIFDDKRHLSHRGLKIGTLRKIIDLLRLFAIDQRPDFGFVRRAASFRSKINVNVSDLATVTREKLRITECNAIVLFRLIGYVGLVPFRKELLDAESAKVLTIRPMQCMVV